VPSKSKIYRLGKMAGTIDNQRMAVGGDPTAVINVVIAASKGQKTLGPLRGRKYYNVDGYDVHGSNPLNNVNDSLWNLFQAGMSWHPTVTENLMLLVLATVLVLPIMLGPIIDPLGELGKKAWFIAFLVIYYTVACGAVWVYVKRLNNKISRNRQNALDSMASQFQDAGYSLQMCEYFGCLAGDIKYVRFSLGTTSDMDVDEQNYKEDEVTAEMV
jgi:hypothetical protein